MKLLRSIGVSILVVLILACMLPMTVLAEVKIQNGLPDFTINDTRTVIHFGGKEWYVIGKGEGVNGIEEGEGVAPREGNLTLLAKDSFGKSAFRNGQSAEPTDKTDWQRYSGDNRWYQGVFKAPSDYGDSTLMRAMKAEVGKLSSKETALVTARDLKQADGIGGDPADGQKFWPLSLTEYLIMGVLPSDKFSDLFWLRFPDGVNGAYVGVRGAAGYYGARGVFNQDILVRPAFNLDLSSVLFTSSSAAEGGKSSATVGGGLVGATAPTGGMKLTVISDYDKDTNPDGLSLNTEITAISVASGTEVKIPYTGAKTGKNRSVSVAICKKDTGDILFYGRPVDCSTDHEDGEASFTMPSVDELSEGEYTLKIFNEEVIPNETDTPNIRAFTDCASTPVSIGLTVDNLPMVESITPSGDGVDVNGKIAITFSEAMDTADSVGSVSLDNEVGKLSGGTWSDDNKIYTIPYSGLNPNTNYTINISGFQDAVGNAMVADNSNSFTTAVAPTVTGPTGLTLPVGYGATATEAFVITGTEPITVELNDTCDDKITWNNENKKLDIAAGLVAGQYKITLTAKGAGGSATCEFVLTVSAANDCSLPSIEEDSISDGATINNLLGTEYDGILITNNPNMKGTQGQWEYRSDKSTGSWKALPDDLSTKNAMYLPAGYSLRFLPVTDYNGNPASLQVVLLGTGEGESYTGEEKYNTNGFANPVSISITITVKAINDAPVWLASPQPITTIKGDSFSTNGASVFSLFGGYFSDDNDNQYNVSNPTGSYADAFAGIVVAGVTFESATGDLTYSIDGGTCWEPFPSTVTETQALYLTENTLLRCVFDPEYEGNASVNLSVYLVDSSTKPISSGTIDFSDVDKGGIASVSALYQEFTILYDATPPTVSNITPSGVGVDVNGKIAITFSEAMNTVPGVGSVSLDNEVGKLSGGSWSDGTTYTIPFKNLTKGTTYTITVSGFQDKAGNVMVEDARNSFKTADVPGAPTKLSATPGDKQLNLSWDAPQANGGTTITGYQYKLGEDGWKDTGDTATNHVLTNLSNGTEYTVSVRAVNAMGAGAASQDVIATPNIVPNAPTELSAIPGDKQLKLSWDAPQANGGTAITGYQYSIDNGQNWTSNQNVTKCTINGLENGKEYTVMVQAKNEMGWGASASVTGTPNIVPNAPTELSATPGDKQLNLSWDAPQANGGTAITGYQYSIDGGKSWTPTNSAEPGFTLENLTNGKEYTISVRAVNAMGAGVASDGVKAIVGVSPTITSANKTAVAIGTVGSFEVTASGTDPLTYSLIGAPIGVTVDSKTGIMTIADKVSAGSHKFNIKVSNGTTTDATQEFTLTVKARPTVVSVTPSGKDVPISGNVVITFSEAMNTTVGSVSLVPEAGDAKQLDGGSWSNDNKTYTIAYADLTANTKYTVNISGFVDAAGIAMELNSTNSFTTAVAPNITGPKDLTLVEGYDVTTSEAFTITGTGKVAVTLDETYDGKITWKDGTKCLEIAAGLAPKEYPVVLTASNGVAPDAKHTFTLTVSAKPVAPTISGPESQDLVEGYDATTSDLFTVKGDEPITVKLDNTYGDKIVWNSEAKKLDIKAGLGEGSYPVVLTASNGVAPNATHTFTLTVSTKPVAPTISGPESQDLVEGYETTESGVFTITGTGKVTVTLDETYDGKITWNDGTKCLEIVAGLVPGEYPVVLTASNGAAPEATHTFTLTVTKAPLALAISGPDAQSLVEGYEATTSDLFTITGDEPITIKLDKDYGGKITWNDGTQKLNIQAGLGEGSYPVMLTASNGVAPNATHTFTLSVTKAPVAPAISGPESQDLVEGYDATTSDLFTITGDEPITVELDKDYDGKITWNDGTQKLNIQAGFGVGSYPVVLTASNGVEPEAKHTFTLTVSAQAIVTREWTDDTTGVVVSGKFMENGVPGRLVVEPLGEGQGSYQELVLAGKEVIAAFEVYFDGPYTLAPGEKIQVKFPVDPSLNGQTILIRHRLDSGEVEEFTPTVADGAVTILVDELSPFMLMKDQAAPVPSTKPTPTPGSKPATGDTSAPQDWLAMLVLGVLAAGTCLYLRRGKQAQK